MIGILPQAGSVHSKKQMYSRWFLPRTEILLRHYFTVRSVCIQKLCIAGITIYLGVAFFFPNAYNVGKRIINKLKFY